MDSVEAPHRCTIITVTRSVKPTDLFLALASNNIKAISLFISEVKDACSEFVTDVCALIGDEEEYSGSEYDDSEYSDSEYDDSDYSDSDSEVDSDADSNVENDDDSDSE